VLFKRQNWERLLNTLRTIPQINSFSGPLCLTLLPQVDSLLRLASSHKLSTCCEPGSRGAVHHTNIHSESRNVDA